MGYHIYIGEPSVKLCREDSLGMLVPTIVVQMERSYDAPYFDNDDLTEKTNYRAPSYNGWEEFTKESDLHHLFYNAETGLMTKNPGAALLNTHHLAEVKHAIAKWAIRRKEESMGIAGFALNQDRVAANLMWLEYWIKWALEYCTTPVFYTSR